MTEQALPAGWAWTTLGDVVLPVGKTDPASFDRPQFKYIDISAVDGDTQLLNDVPSVAVGLAPSRARQLVRAGDTVFSTVRPYLRKIAWLPEHLDGEIASTGFCVLRPSSVIDSRFLFFAVTRQDFLDEVTAKQRGVSYPAVRPAEVLEVPIPLPPLPEQHRIVEALEDHLSRVDAAEQSLSTAKQRLSPLRKSAIQIALDQEFDGGEGHSAAERLERILADRVALASKRRAKPANPAYELDLPTGWVTASVDQLCWDIQYGTSSKTGELRDGSDVPVLRMGNVQDGDIDPRNLKYLPADDPSIDGLLLAAGDLLFNRTNSAELVGKTAVFSDQLEQATFASYLIRCRPVPGVNAQWISHIANSPIGRRYITSVMSQQVGQANVNGTKLAAMPIPIAPQDVEARILDEISETRSSSARLDHSVEVAKARSAALRRSLLRAAFNGELVDQDPTDEPADVALAKIRDQQSRTAPRRRRNVVAAK